MVKFGTGGFRGVIGEDFIKSNIQLVIQALACLANDQKSEKPIIVGFDHRFSSDYAAKWVAEVLAGNGIECYVYDEVMPSPAIMSVVKNHDLDFGVMITASHNPYYYNGIKLFTKGGVDADVEFTNSLESYALKVTQIKSESYNLGVKKGKIKIVNYKEEYLSDIKAYISKDIEKNNAKILFNNLCGVGFVGLKPLSRDFRIKKFDILNENHDPFFNNQNPNPTKEMMLSMRETVLINGYDYAMATDSDGDRLGILDEKGNYVDSNDILACLYYYLVKYKKLSGDIVKNCATSTLVDKLANKLGFKCHEVDVGFKNISSKMLEVDALIGGESSGGLTVRGYVMGKDSVFSASLFMEMVIVMKKTVSEIVEEVHDFSEYTNFIVEDSLVVDMQSVKDKLSKGNPEFVKELISCNKFNSNYKYYFKNDTWALIRLSGTEPIVRIFTEMSSQKQNGEQILAIKKFLA